MFPPFWAPHRLHVRSLGAALPAQTLQRSAISVCLWQAAGGRAGTTHLPSDASPAWLAGTGRRWCDSCLDAVSACRLLSDFRPQGFDAGMYHVLANLAALAMQEIEGGGAGLPPLPLRTDIDSSCDFSLEAEHLQTMLPYRWAPARPRLNPSNREAVWLPACTVAVDHFCTSVPVYGQLCAAHAAVRGLQR